MPAIKSYQFYSHNNLTIYHFPLIHYNLIDQRMQKFFSDLAALLCPVISE